MVLTTTNNVVAKMISRGVSHKAVALLGKCSNEQSLQRVSEYSMWQLSILKLV